MNQDKNRAFLGCIILSWWHGEQHSVKEIHALRMQWCKLNRTVVIKREEEDGLELTHQNDSIIYEVNNEKEDGAKNTKWLSDIVKLKAVTFFRKGNLILTAHCWQCMGCGSTKFHLGNTDFEVCQEINWKISNWHWLQQYQRWLGFITTENQIENKGGEKTPQEIEGEY